MDGNLFEAIAILIIILAGGISNIAKMLRERSKRMQETDPVNTGQQKPSVQNAQRNKTAQRPPAAPQHSPAPEPPQEEVDTMTTIFKEFFGVEDEELVIVDERPKPKPKKKPKAPPKPTLKKISKPPQRRMPLYSSTAAVRRAKPVPNPFLVQLAKSAEKEPLKAAVIFHEIMQPPRALRGTRTPIAH